MIVRGRKNMLLLDKVMFKCLFMHFRANYVKTMLVLQKSHFGEWQADIFNAKTHFFLLLMTIKFLF